MKKTLDVFKKYTCTKNSLPFKYVLNFIFFIAIFTFQGCNKSDSSSSSQSSEWTFNGKTYTVNDASYDISTNELKAEDDLGAVGGGNFVAIDFGSLLKPSGSTTLSAVDFQASSNPANCVVVVGNVYASSYYLSTGKSGDKVILAVSSSGKLKASFTNITVSNDFGTTTKSLSGTLVEN